jgi:SAM-dependent methyltransferase
VLHGADGYGEAFADVYDDWYGSAFDTEGAVTALRRLAGAGPVLDLGVGTGRLALPLAADGLVVVGLDASRSMLDHLAAKPGADAVRTVLADMADVASAVPAWGGDVPTGGYRLVVCAYNTLLNLHTEHDQRRCLAGIASLLAPDGTAVVEAFVPAEPHEVPRTSLEVAQVTADRVVLTATEHDAAHQVVTGQHVELRDGSVRMRPWRIRYLSPGQLDELAASAGLTMVERWADWRGGVFDDASDGHVSLYRRAPVPGTDG